MRLYHNKDWLRQKYHGERLSTIEIAKICQVLRGTIWKWMKKFNIKRRTLFDCLIIWENEIYNQSNEVLEKTNNFIGGLMV